MSRKIIAGGNRRPNFTYIIEIVGLILAILSTVGVLPMWVFYVATSLVLAIFAGRLIWWIYPRIKERGGLYFWNNCNHSICTRGN